MRTDVERHDGGPAFPTGGTNTHRDGTLMSVEHRGGMSLRDYFAAKFMATFLHGASLPPGFDATEQLDFTAARSYECADALLRARG